MPFVNKQENATPEGDERKRPRNCMTLIDQLTDPNPTARRWAARDMAECPDGALALVAQLKVEHDLAVREVILSSLAKLKNQEAIDGLVECLRSDDAALRNEAIEVMQQCPDEVEHFIMALLDDNDPDVRIFAVNILESLCHPDIEKWLIGVIDRDPQVNVCATAAGILAEIGTLAARESLAALSRRFVNEPFLVFTAELALKRIGKGTLNG
jgi:HEAT repeat protein